MSSLARNGRGTDCTNNAVVVYSSINTEAALSLKLEFPSPTLTTNKLFVSKSIG
ncbi:hypothetical protein ACFSJU_11660 [Paradesertivirga mongoliensis]|uniref:Uncharacterized protein n=1 Tax=Paradesertivirga mongoliensis TaxID=2100740 RepID=A0ABW4ZN97_9SPHI|nr:hypothetical protein [Pedobacter mongoliensis]